MTKGDREAYAEWGSDFDKNLPQVEICKSESGLLYTGVARVRKQRTPFANKTRGNVFDKGWNRRGGTCSLEDGCARPFDFRL